MNPFVRQHLPCPMCPSSDGFSEREDGSGLCFSCNQSYFPPRGSKTRPTLSLSSTKAKKALTDLSDAFYGAFPDRRISSTTAKHFGVKQDMENIYFPYHDDKGELVARKTRTPDKDFRIEGDWKGAQLFGQHLFPKGGKYVTLVEGEFDVLAAYQMLGNYPVVSIRNGAGSARKDCQEHYEWLDSFETIVVCFDADKQGVQAAQEVAELFTGKVKVFKHDPDYKDACDYLAAKQERSFSKLWWQAEDYRPEGIVTVTDIRERLLTPPEPGVPWCFPTLTTLTYGRRKGELYAFGAGVGIGKTDVFTQQIAYDIDQLGKKVGVIYLEQNVVETAQRVAGKLDKRLYHVPDAVWTREEYEESVNRLEKRGQLYMMEHFGAKDWSSIKRIVKYFSKAYDIEHIYLDHLTALSANEQDERRALDAIMADMAGLAQSDNLIIHFVSHLTTPDGKPHEEGGRVMEKHFTGSRAIARWSHYMFGLERDKQHKDPVMRQTTTFRVLKDRFTGRATAERFGLLYDRNTGILSEAPINEDF